MTQGPMLLGCNVNGGSTVNALNRYSPEAVKFQSLCCFKPLIAQSLESTPSTSKSLVVRAVIDKPLGSGPDPSYKSQSASQWTNTSSSGFFLDTGLEDDVRGNFKSAEHRIHELVVKRAAALQTSSKQEEGRELSFSKETLSPSFSSVTEITPELLGKAYDRCEEICAEYAKTFYLGTKLMTPERRRAIWAIYVWCRRTDELVDGPNASRITPRALDRWEERLEDLFRGRPYDMLDAALAEVVADYPLDIQPFRDMVDGMRMDIRKQRYQTFDELYSYCYNVAGTVGLMSVPVMGLDPASRANPEFVYGAALALGIANQLTNILRDVGEDASRGRVYLPQDELRQFGLSDRDIFEGVVTPKWREFMRFQIARARQYFKRAEIGVPELDRHSRWPVWASLSLYRQILDAIEANDYNNFTKRAYVPKWRKLLSLPAALLIAQKSPSAAPQESFELC